MDSKSRNLAIGASAALLALGGMLYLWKSKSARGDKEEIIVEDAGAASAVVQDDKEEEIKVDLDEVKDWPSLTDPNYEGQKFLSKKEATFRSQVVSNVSYVISLGLLKGGETFNGRILIDFDISKIQDDDFVEGGDNSKCLFIDYKGK